MKEFFPDLSEQLRRDLDELPDNPGVYLMHSHNKQILYIGKAKNLQRRVRSYFNGSKDLKTEMLRRKVNHVEVLLCANDYEALILENNLIKKYKPRYNINLKDDKSYPLVCITKEDYPRVFKTRVVKRNGSQYFGPYPNGVQLDTTLKLVQELFPLRRCRGPLLKRKTPCLYYHIKQCLGPCIDAISKEEYGRQVTRARHLLNGSNKVLLQELERDMRSAAAAMRFEEAARLRDRISSLRNLQQDQSMEGQERPQIGRDYLAMLKLEDYYFFTVLLVRDGKLMGHYHFSSRYLTEKNTAAKSLTASANSASNASNLENLKESQPQESEVVRQEDSIQKAEKLRAETSKALVEFLCLYYLDPERDLPDELFLPELDLDWAELELFLQVLKDKRKQGFLLRPFSREREAHNDRSLLLRARENVIREQQLWLRYQGRGMMLEELRKAIDLPDLPEHIEGFDISHMAGQATVASLVVFREGKPAKDEYRSMNLRTTEGSPNDVHSIREAVSRRYTRLLNEGQTLPDLVLIDGGQGQVNAAAEILRSLELNIRLLGLAKREEILYFPHISYDKEAIAASGDDYSSRREPLNLPLGHPGLKLLQQVRDETHRVAHDSNRKRYGKKVSASVLENVPGVGKKRSAKLLQHYGSLQELAKVQREELARVGGMGLEVADTVVEYLARRK